MAQAQRARSGSDSGFTLVELLIYMAFSVIVLSLVGGMMISTLNAQKSIVARSEATTSGQAVAQSVHSGVRNAVNHTLTPTNSRADTDQLLVVQSLDLGTETNPTCLAWYYSTAGDGAIYYQRSAAPITAPEGTDSAGWLLLATGVQSPTGIFDDAGSGSGTRIALSFSVSADAESAPVWFESTTISRENRSETACVSND